MVFSIRSRISGIRVGRLVGLVVISLLLCAHAVTAQQRTVADGPSASLSPELKVFQPLIGTWEAMGPGFRSRLTYRIGLAGAVVYADNSLLNKTGDEIERYEGSYFWSPQLKGIQFQTLSNSGEIHSGHVETGATIWHVATVDGGGIDGYRSGLDLTGPNTFEYRVTYRAAASESDVLSEEPLLYERVDEASLETSDLPFKPPVPHATIGRMGELEGQWRACSRRLDPDGSETSARAFEVTVRRLVMGQAVSIDMGGQSSFVVFDPKEDVVSDITASAIGAIEYWDEADPWDDEVVAFQLRGKARFMIGDDPDLPVDFRKAYSEISPDRYELAYYLSADDGANWQRLFYQVGVRGSSNASANCAGVGEGPT